MTQYTPNPEDLQSDTEIWKPVVGYEGLYEVSNFGRVRGLKRGKVLRDANTNGYRYVNLCKEAVTNVTRVHQIVARAFIGECPEGHEIDHLDRNRANNRLSNLEYVTHRENMRRATKDAPLWQGKFSEQTIREIFEMAQDRSNTYKKISEALGVKVGSIHLILSGKRRSNPKGLGSIIRKKLTPEDVAEIRNILATNNINQAQLARQYGVHPSVITRIKNGERT